jgi:homoserine kinase
MTFEVRVPASTSNLGPGFDCFGLALKIYLTVRATAVPDAGEQCRVVTTGAKENEALPRNAVNLIYRAMAFATRRQGVSLPPVDLQVHNDIPLASGLGSSAAAIVAGIKLGGLLTGGDIPDEMIQNYATEFEGHPDNVAASLYGGFVASCTCHDGAVVSAKFTWPAQIRVVVVSPHSQLPTHVARAALPRTVSRHDAATLRHPLGGNARSFTPTAARVTRARTRGGAEAPTNAGTLRHRIERSWSKYRCFGR